MKKHCWSQETESQRERERGRWRELGEQIRMKNSLTRVR